MFKRAKVVMLPTNEKANALWWSGHRLYVKGPEDSSRGELNHLYFLSDDEEIKDVDWIYRRKDGYETIQKATLPLNLTSVNKKIIATTDKSLTTNSIYGIDSFDASIFSGSGKSQMVKLPQMFNLPQPSYSFIEKFVEEYNKGNVITEVMVEYEKYIGKNYVGEFTTEKDFDYKLKINLKDNTITIRKVKDSWNREEMLNLLESAWNGGALYGSSKPNSHYFDKWIEENL